MHKFISVCLFSFLVTHSIIVAAGAAEVKVVTNAECPVTLTGKIVDGDLERLSKAIEPLHLSEIQEAAAGEHSVCLNSDGGSYVEGRKISEYIYTNGIGTRVTSGNECLSACANIFMSGRIHGDENDGTYRYLHANGVLGFHAPYLTLDPKKSYTARDVELAFDNANRISSDFIKFGSVASFSSANPWIRASLIAAILEKPRNDILLIDTIEKAERWDITVYGVRKMDISSKESLAQACVNFQHWAADQPSEKIDSTQMQYLWKGTQQLPPTNEMFARIDTGGMVEQYCDVRSQVGEDGGGYFQLCSINEFNGVNHGGCPGYGMILSSLYGLPPTTPLRDVIEP